MCHHVLIITGVQYRRSLHTEYAVCVGHQLPGGHRPSCSKKKLLFYINIKINIYINTNHKHEHIYMFFFFYAFYGERSKQDNHN